MNPTQLPPGRNRSRGSVALRGHGLLASIVVLVISLPLLPRLAGSLAAQQPQFLPGPREGKDTARLPMDDSVRAAGSAAAVVGMGTAPGALGVLYAGRSTSMWDGLATPVPEDPARRRVAARLDPDLLVGVEDRAPVRGLQENPDEVRAYIYVLVQAHQLSADALAVGARHDLTFAHLFEEPGKYRGQIVHIEGRLKRLRRFDAPSFAAQQGVPIVYEGWIVDDISYRHPYCVLMTDLPPTIQPGERIDYAVAFDGYFFKRYRYQAGEGWRDAPLLIGRTLLPRSGRPASESDGSLANAPGPGFLGVLLASVVAAIGLGWWYRRGDRKIQRRLAQSRLVHFVEPDAAEATPRDGRAKGAEAPPWSGAPGSC